MITFSRIEIETKVRVWLSEETAGKFHRQANLASEVTVSRVIPGRMEKDVLTGIENLNADVNLAVRKQLHLNR